MKRWLLALLVLGVLVLSSCGPAADPANNPVVVIDTSMGPIKVQLYQDKAPITVKNFLDYVDEKHYDGTIFHRVIKTFMIQGGAFTPEMKQKPGQDPIRNESSNGLTNKRGTLAMARTDKPDSASDQFFINVVDNDFLDRANDPKGVGYAVFGRVLEGMDVVDKIRDVETANVGGFEGLPVEPVIIKSIRRVDKK